MITEIIHKFKEYLAYRKKLRNPKTIEDALIIETDAKTAYLKTKGRPIGEDIQRIKEFVKKTEDTISYKNMVGESHCTTDAIPDDISMYKDKIIEAFVNKNYSVKDLADYGVCEESILFIEWNNYKFIEWEKCHDIDSKAKNKSNKQK